MDVERRELFLDLRFSSIGVFVYLILLSCPSRLVWSGLILDMYLVSICK